MVEAAVVLVHSVWSFPGQPTSGSRSALVVALIAMSLACFHPESMEDVIPKPANVLQLLGLVLALNSLAGLCLVVVELTVIIRPIGEDESSIAVSLAMLEIADEETTVLFVHRSKSIGVSFILSEKSHTASSSPRYTSPPYLRR